MRRLPRRQLLHLAAGAAATLTAFTAPAAAQSPSLAGKNVQMIIASGPGGGYDIWGRFVARHIGKHLSGNPTIVPQNMPGGGGLNAANYLYNVAPKDGTVVGVIAGGAVLGPIMSAPGARFDPTRITWLGSPTRETQVCMVYNSSQMRVKTVKDLYEKELIVGTSGTGNSNHIYPKVLSALLGMKFKVITGFQTAPTVYLAMERGEVEGVCATFDSVSGSRPNWIADKKVTMLFRSGTAPNPQLQDVPFLNDLARTTEERQAIELLYGFGRPFVAPPDLPADRMKMLRDAFIATMKDADFLAEAQKLKVDVDPEGGETLAALVGKMYATPKHIVDKIAELIK